MVGFHKLWKIASVEDWYDATLCRPRGKWIWCPPPCLAREAIDQLCEVKHMYLESSHLFVCPALMTGYWQKAAGKVGDVMVTVSAGCNVWKAVMLEPLTLVFVAPLLSHRPWRIGWLPSVLGRGTPNVMCNTIKTDFRSSRCKTWMTP